jgi:predicted ATPase
LDEPEAALSPTRQMSLLSRMHQLVQARSQFVIAAHSPILLGYPNAAIYVLERKGMRRVAYEDTEHFRVTRDFLNGYQSMVKTLTGDVET